MNSRRNKTGRRETAGKPKEDNFKKFTPQSRDKRKRITDFSKSKRKPFGKKDEEDNTVRKFDAHKTGDRKKSFTKTGGDTFRRKRFIKRDDETKGEERKFSGRSKPGSKRFERDDKKVFKKSFGDRRKGKSYGKNKFKTPPEERTDGLIRLNKFISNAGICSRREADELITAGLISVNGKLITELGTKISPNDEIKYNGETMRREKPVYVLLNKPKDYITTTDDPGQRKTVMELIAKACRERIYPVGRLDRNTTGVLLFTNDGELATRLMHPANNIQKIYQVELDKNISVDHIRAISEGVKLDDGLATVDDIQYDSFAQSKRVVGIALHSGKNRIVRRIFESLGYDVRKLDRVVFAGLTKKDLPRGRWRFLTEIEVNMLKMLGGEKEKVK